MKHNLYCLLTCLFLAGLGIGLTSCDDKHDEPAPILQKLSGTSWVYQDHFSDGSVLTQTISFSGSTATLKISYKEGTEEQITTYNYSYTSDESNTKEATLVALYPKQAGNATLEGKIESFLKMTVTNTSSGSEIGVFYKQ